MIDLDKDSEFYFNEKLLKTLKPETNLNFKTFVAAIRRMDERDQGLEVGQSW